MGGNSDDSDSGSQPLIKTELMNVTGASANRNTQRKQQEDEEEHDVLLPIVAAKLHYVNETGHDDGHSNDDNVKLKKTELLMSTNTNGTNDSNEYPKQRNLKKMLSEGPTGASFKNEQLLKTD